MFKLRYILFKLFGVTAVISLILVASLLIGTRRVEAATCLDGTTQLPPNVLTGGHEYDFCKPFGGYNGGDISVCNDGTKLPSSAITGGHEVEFCSDKLGYMGAPPNVTPTHPADTGTFTQDPAKSCTTSAGDSTCGFVHKYVDPAVNFLAIGFGIIITIMIIVGGIQYSSSRGDPQAVAAAKKKITNAVLALIAFGFLYAFLNFVIPGGLQ